MKKILALVLAMILCLSVFTACNTNEPSTNDSQYNVESAKAYVKSMYKDYLVAGTLTPADFKMATQVLLDGVAYTIAWTTNTDKVTVTEDADAKEATVNVDEKASEALEYTLTGTISAPDGTTATLAFKLGVPKYAVNSWAEYAAACEANDASKTITIIGYVVAVNASVDSSGVGTMWVQDADGYGYYVYAPTLADEEKASREALEAAYPVGTEVEVTGTVTTYSGCLEFNKGCSVTKTGKTVDSADIIYNDATEAFGSAADNKDRATLDRYQSARVIIRGATLTDVDGSYYYFTVNGVKYNLYRNNYFFEDAVIEELFAKFVKGIKADITGVVSVYSGQFQIYPDTVNSITAIEAELTDEEKVSLEIGNIALDSTISSDKEITLPLVGATNADVTFAWTLEESANATLDAATGKLTVTIPEGEATITLKVVVTCGDKSDEKTFEIKLSKVVTPIVDILEIGATITEDTKETYIVSGVVTSIANTKYGNLYITDAAGNTLYIYGLYDTSNVRFDSMDEAIKPEVGDYITVTSVISTYNNTPQLKNAVITSCVKPSSFEDVNTAGSGLVENNEQTDDKYLVVGTVSEIKSDKYGNLYITDAEGNSLYIYGTYSENGSVRYDSMDPQPAVGDTITVYGVISIYSGALQLKNVWVVAITPAKDVDAPEEDEAIEATIPEALALEDGTKVIVAGTVTEINYDWSDSNNNMSVTISDAEGNELYVYKLATKVAEGDSVVITGTVGSYNGAKQIAAGATAVIAD